MVQTANSAGGLEFGYVGLVINSPITASRGAVGVLLNVSIVGIDQMMVVVCWLGSRGRCFNIDGEESFVSGL